MKKIKINKKVLRVAKWSTIVGTTAFVIQACGKIELARQEAVVRANTFSAMFGSLANYVGDDVLNEWNEQLAQENPDLAMTYPPEETQGLAERLELPEGAFTEPEPLRLADATEIEVNGNGEASVLDTKHGPDTIDIIDD